MTKPLSAARLWTARPAYTAPTTPCPPPNAGDDAAVDRRGVLKAGMLLCAFGVHHLARAQIGEQHYPKTAGIGNRKGIVAIRIWPAPEYSRVTIESENELEATYEMLSDPPRLFVDINHLQLGPELRNLETHVQADDPNIAGIRIAQNQPTVVRMVLDLKQPVRPEVFTLKPIDPYQHRLVFDLYPLTPVDPMAQLIEERLRTIAQAPDTAATPLPAPAVPPAAPLPAPDASDPLGDWIRQNGDRPVPAPAVPAPVPAPPPVRPPPPPPPPVPSPPATRRQTDRIYIVALDPGHGGEDPGAIGPSRTFEKNVVLAIALQVRERLNRSRVNGVPVQAFMTRDRDFFVPLATRVERARRVQSDLFVSIHADAALNRSARGASVYALHPRGATSAAARLLAEQENRADQVGGLNIHSKDRHVQNTLAAMSLDAQIRDSLALGAIMRTALGKATTVRGSRVEQANFAVLRNPDTPSVLVETGFISNPQEEQLLRSARHQAKLADAIAAGVLGYLERFPPLPRVRSV